MSYRYSRKSNFVRNTTEHTLASTQQQDKSFDLSFFFMLLAIAEGFCVAQLVIWLQPHVLFSSKSLNSQFVASK